MSTQTNAADRVRPFLQAMERSIAAARQRRLQTPPGAVEQDEHEPPGNDPAAAPPPVAPGYDDDDENRPRLRARPKRPNMVGSGGGLTSSG